MSCSGEIGWIAQLRADSIVQTKAFCVVFLYVFHNLNGDNTASQCCINTVDFLRVLVLGFLFCHCVVLFVCHHVKLSSVPDNVSSNLISLSKPDT